MSPEPYKDPRSVEMAIKEAVRAMHAADPAVSVGERIRQSHFDRLLCRVFSQGAHSDWVLKGGTGMLARIPNTRATKGFDLFATGYTLDQALAALRQLSAVDLGDYFRFEYVSHSESVAGDQHPYAEGYRVAFQAFLGTKQLGDIGVDLVVSVGGVTGVEVIEPANRIDLPRLTTFPYRLYPVERQIADKVCATIAVYSSGPSSSEKDLVDLVAIANTQTVDATRVRTAIMKEARLRGLGQVVEFSVPSNWGPAYEKEARKVPVCERHFPRYWIVRRPCSCELDDCPVGVLHSAPFSRPCPLVGLPPSPRLTTSAHREAPSIQILRHTK